MMIDDPTKHAQFLIDTAIKLRLLADLPTDFLKFISDVEMNPSPENVARIERWNADAAAYLEKRAEQFQPDPQFRPEFFVQNRQIN